MEEKQGNKKNVIWLSIVSFINDTASKIIMPILPLFITDLGGTGIAVGLISGLGTSIASIFKMTSGYWSDKIAKRKAFVFWGYLTSQISKLLLAFASIWPHVLILRIAERLGKGLRSAPRDAILAASTVKEKRGKGFGLHRAMDSGGALLGALLAFVFFWYLGMDFKNIFLIAGIIGLFSLLPIIPVKEKAKEKKQMNLKVGLKSLSGKLKLFIVVATIYALGNFSYMFFVLKSEVAFKGKLAVGIPILLYALYNLTYSLFAIPAGIISDKIGRKKVLIMGYSLFGLVSLGFIFLNSLIAFIFLFLLFGINYALVNATERAFVSDMSDSDIRGTALGTFHMFTSIAALPAGLIAGALWDVNTVSPFVYGAALSFITVISFILLDKKQILH